MKKLILVLSFICAATANAQVLPLPEVIQEQDQWCWAACSKSILNYYGYPVDQCTIADYTRTAATWHSFGTTPCCTSAADGCNYWNYNWGATGSIQDILVHFDTIANHGSGPITLDAMKTQIADCRPFVCRWGWVSGGGHFIVAHGVDATDNIHYMNPWFGEGYHICTYSWMQSDGTHNYTHTNIMDRSPFPASVAGPITGPSAVTVGSTITLTDTSVLGTWYSTNGKTTVSATGAVTGIAPGTDTLLYVVTNGCGADTAQHIVTVNTPVSISSTMAAGKLTIYPNPGNGNCYLHLSTPATQPFTLTIHNIMGQQVQQITLPHGQQHTLQLNLPNGNYTLNATTTTTIFTGTLTIIN